MTIAEVPRRGTNIDRAVVFLAGILARGIVGWIFFGSVDLTNAMLNAARVMYGVPLAEVPVPYFPGPHQLLIWTSAALAIGTPLPLAFAYKVFPLVFDAALAVLVYDFLLPDRSRARRAAWLYALAPVPIIVTSIHTQWDAMCVELLLLSFLLMLRRTTAAYALAGVAFVASVLIKPMPVPFLPLLFPAPWRLWAKDGVAERQQALAVLGGMAATTLAYLGILYTLGEPLTFHTVYGILYYANYGTQIFGLAVITGGYVNRLIAFAPLLLFVPLYWKGRVTRQDVVMLMLAFLTAASGMGPQYLLWIVPFLFACGKEWYGAIYTLIAGIFLVLYYHHPGPAGPENLGAFAPLRSLAWLAPSATFQDVKMKLITFLGSIALPISALLFFIYELVKILRRKVTVPETRSFLTLWQILAPTAVGFLVIAIGFGVAEALPPPTFDAFADTVRAKTQDYAMYRYKGPGLRNPVEPTWIIPAFKFKSDKSPIIDVVSIGYVWVLIWCVASWMAWQRALKRA